jgi:hypothetical protein
MPTQDLFHEAVRIGLEKEGWTITADPLKLELENKPRVFIDLAAEKIIEACAYLFIRKHHSRLAKPMECVRHR